MTRDDCHYGAMQTVFEAAGGNDGLRRLADAWHRRVMADDVVGHSFSHGFHPQHVERLAAYCYPLRREFAQVLINAVTVHVGTSTQVTGNATNRALVSRRDFSGKTSCPRRRRERPRNTELRPIQLRETT